MAENTKIAWADHTMNPWIGCTRIVCRDTPESECDRCYAASVSEHYKLAEWGPGKPRKRTSEKYWREPVKWNTRAGRNGVPELVFCASMADVFDGEVEDAWRDDLFDLIEATPNLIWLVLSKRDPRPYVKRRMASGKTMPTNIWWGFSAGHQEALEGRWPWYESLAKMLPYMPVIWVSAEPLLGPLNLTGKMMTYGRLPIPAINWVIVGGESGHKARRTDPEWVLDIETACRLAGVPYFFKQLGVVLAAELGVNGKGEDPDIVPDNVRRMFIRQHPLGVKEAA